MPELRLNMISRDWVIFPAEKRKRPEEFIGARERKKHPEFVATCPFCPGNEEKSPGERYRVHNENGWDVRVVLNKFSVLCVDGERKRVNEGLKKSVNGVGSHELVIESPLHNHTTALMPHGHLAKLLEAYKDCLIEAYKDSRVEHVLIFKNSGHESGTSIEHPLSQIVGLPITPFQVRSRIESAMRYFDDTGECLLCNTIGQELADGARILFTTGHFVSFVPYAAASPFHVWIFPKRHSGYFGDIRPEEVVDLAAHLKSVMSRIYYGLAHPDFNYIIKSGRPSHSDSAYIHWYLTIVPRVAMTSGFELGSGMFINPLLPEASADFLRRVKIPEYA